MTDRVLFWEDTHVRGLPRAQLIRPVTCGDSPATETVLFSVTSGYKIGQAVSGTRKAMPTRPATSSNALSYDEIWRDRPLDGLVNNAAGNFIAARNSFLRARSTRSSIWCCTGRRIIRSPQASVGSRAVKKLRSCLSLLVLRGRGGLSWLLLRAICFAERRPVGQVTRTPIHGS